MALEMGISFHRGLAGGPGGGGSFTGDSEREIRALEMELLYGSSVKGTWREGSFTGSPEGYIKEGSGNRYPP
jgi:hypothetical protein